MVGRDSGQKVPSLYFLCLVSGVYPFLRSVSVATSSVAVVSQVPSEQVGDVRCGREQRFENRTGSGSGSTSGSASGWREKGRMEQLRDCEENDRAVPSHGDENEGGADGGKRKTPARLGFRLRRVLNIARKGAPCTPVQAWKAEELGSSPARDGGHTAAGDYRNPTCSGPHLRRRSPSVARPSSSRTLVPNFWEAQDIHFQHPRISRGGATSRSPREEKLAKPFVSRLPVRAASHLSFGSSYDFLALIDFDI